MSARKPTALKVLEGNPGKQKLNPAEPKPRPQAPACPSWLQAEAREQWAELAPEMERLGLLTVVDGPAFAALCQTYARWREAEQKLSGGEDGDPTAQERFHLTAEIGRYLAQIRAFCSEFGLTPASRGRIQLPSAAQDDDLGGLLR